eukprot:TRINITY_DN1923_c0_g1_i1.p1 TRINITY_DN1923_c0_g1~~TRINITY_DN1923_c0_g1_i1.p1  ORF type:complete len:720 (-),score=135.53 TRINITY_DN1923_c0_g1_i1:41-2200(-)
MESWAEVDVRPDPNEQNILFEILSKEDLHQVRKSENTFKPKEEDRTPLQPSPTPQSPSIFPEGFEEKAIFILDDELAKEQKRYRSRSNTQIAKENFLRRAQQEKAEQQTQPKRGWFFGFLFKYRKELWFFFLIVLPILIVGIILNRLDKHVYLWGESFVRWSFAFLFAWTVVLGARLLVNFVWLIATRLLSENMTHLYLISGMSRAVVMVICASVYKAIWHLALPNLESGPRDVIEKIFTLAIIISVLFLSSRVLQKVISLHTNAQSWHLELKKALLQEQLVERLIEPRIMPSGPSLLTSLTKTLEESVMNTTQRFYRTSGEPLVGQSPQLSLQPSPDSSQKGGFFRMFSKEPSKADEPDRDISKRQSTVPDLHTVLEEDSFLSPSWGSAAGVLRERAGWSETVRSEKAKVYSKRIWTNLCINYERDYLVYQDFLNFLKSEELAKLSIELFDVDKTSEVTRENVRLGLEAIFEHRKFLVDSLEDRDNISRILRNLFNFFFGFIVFLIGLVIFGVDFDTTFWSSVTTLLGLSFAFAQVLQNVIESMITIFVTSPFDVGDRILFPQVDQYPLRVGHIRLMTTLLHRRDGQQFVVPNYMFYESAFVNLKRSRNIYYPFRFTVHHSTTAEQLKMLKDEIKNFLVKNPRHYGKKFEFVIDEILKTNDLRLTVWIEFNIIWHKIERKHQLKSQFILLVHRVCQKYDIQYLQAPKKVEIVPTESLS